MTPLQHQFEPPPRYRPAASAPVSPSAATDRLKHAVGGELAHFLLGALASEPSQRRARD